MKMHFAAIKQYTILNTHACIYLSEKQAAELQSDKYFQKIDVYQLDTAMQHALLIHLQHLRVLT